MSKNNSLIQARSHLPERRSNAEVPLFKRLLTGTLISLGVTILSSLVLISALSAIALANPDPLSLISVFGLVSLMPSMFFGGFVCQKTVRESPLLCGIVSGGVATILSLIVSLCLVKIAPSGYQFWQGALLHSSAVLFSILGALAAGVKKRKKPHRFK